MAISRGILIMLAGGNKPARRLARLFVYVCRLQRLVRCLGGRGACVVDAECIASRRRWQRRVLGATTQNERHGNGGWEGARHTPNENKLSHRWRERALLRFYVLKSSKS